MTAERSRRAVWVALGVLVLGAVLALAGVLSFGAGFRVRPVASAAMSPTLAVGDRFVGSRVSPSQVRRGDLVTVDLSEWGMTSGVAVKRVIAVGGDRLACGGTGPLVLNGRPLDEPYAHPAGYCAHRIDVTVPPGRVFLLGDNRQDSLDSSFFLDRNQGTLPATAVRDRLAWTPNDGFRSPDGGTLELLLGLTVAGLLLCAVAGPALLIALVVRARRTRAVQWAPRTRADSDIGPVDVLES